MKEIVVNTNEIESVWEKTDVCFVKMKSGKVWLCELSKDNSIEDFLRTDVLSLSTKDYIAHNKGLIKLPLCTKDKCERYGKK